MVDDAIPRRPLIERWFSSWLKLSARKPGLCLAALGVFSAGLTPLVLRVDVDARIQSLLPADTASALAVDELRERSTSDAPLYLLVSSSDPKRNRTLARTLRDRARRWPDTVWAIDQRDPEFFSERRMLYLPRSDTEALADRVEEIVEWEECEAIPGCVNLDGRPSDPTQAEIEELFRRLPEVQALQEVIGEDDVFRGRSGQSPREARHSSSGSRAPDGERRAGELCDKEGTVCAVQVALSGNPSDLTYATGVLARAEALFREVTPKDAPRDLRLETSGQYRNAPQTKRAVVDDLSKTATVSTLLVLLILALQFRGLRALLLLIVPITIATVWTLALTGLFHPMLNLISAFTLAILAGLGIDFGVHLLTHYGALRDQGCAPEDALSRTYRTLGPSVTMAMVTTCVGFVSLAAARFRGFSEMGVLAALGVAVALLAFLVVLPPLVFLAHKLRPLEGSLLRTGSPLAWFPIGSPTPRLALPIAAAGALIAVVLAAVGLGAVGPGVRFEYDFSRLRPRSVGHGIAWGGAMHGTTRSASYLMADHPDDLEAAVQTLRAEGIEESSPGPTLISPSSFVPTDQPLRFQAIARLRDAVVRAMERGDATTKERLATILPELQRTKPIVPADLPEWVRGWLMEADGRFGNLAVLYNDFRGSDAREMEQLASELDRLRARFPKLRVASSVALLGEVVPSLKADAPRIVALAVLGLLLTTLVVGRSLRRTMLAIVPIVAAVGATLGIMALIDLRVNFYNLMIFPLTVGIGVDGAIFVVWASATGAVKSHGASAADAIALSARAVLGSTLTTLAAFGAMAIASNPGLVSLAELALVALGATLLANLVWLPAVLLLCPPTKTPSKL